MISDAQKAANAAGAIATGLLSLIIPVPLTTVQWANKHYYLPKESSYTPGRWETLPFQVGIMNCMGNDLIRTVSGAYNATISGASTLIIHFYMGEGSCPAAQFRINYKNGGIFYRSARDGYGFEADWSEFYTTTRKPSAGDVGALPLSGGQLNGALGIGTSSALGGNSIVLGDNDTGFKQNGDGNLDVYANNVHVMRFVSGSIQSNKTINITGRVNPSDYGNFDSRYVKDVRLGSQQYYGVNNWQTWNFQCPSGHVLSGINVQDTGSNSADNIAGVYYRPVQKYINGTWYNVASV